MSRYLRRCSRWIRVPIRCRRQGGDVLIAFLLPGVGLDRIRDRGERLTALGFYLELHLPRLGVFVLPDELRVVNRRDHDSAPGLPRSRYSAPRLFLCEFDHSNILQRCSHISVLSVLITCIYFPSGVLRRIANTDIDDWTTGGQEPKSKQRFRGSFLYQSVEFRLYARTRIAVRWNNCA